MISGAQTSVRVTHARVQLSGKIFFREDIFQGRYLSGKIFAREDFCQGRYLSGYPLKGKELLISG